MRYFIFLFSFLSGGLILNAVDFPTSKGPYALGMGTISSYKSDPWAAYNHSGVLAFEKTNSISAAFQSQYFVEGLNNLCLAGNYKLRNNQTFGLGYSFFGNQYYNESLLKLSIARVFLAKFGCGISLDYYRLQLPSETYSTKRFLTAETAIYFKLSKQIDLGLQVINPFRVRVSEYNDERLPFVNNISLFFNASNKLALAAEWRQVMNGKSGLKLGMEYKASDNLKFRFGIYNKPINPSFGLTYTKKKVSFHLAIAVHPYLKTNSSAGFSFVQ